ncbi:MAG TPA: choice-of-anchor D domain-containing protein, partial [Caldimonas sp.]
MFTRGGTIRRWAALWVLAAGALFVSAAEANTYADTCTGCHATNATSPPFMPSQDATFGKIMKEGAHFTDNCSATFNCVLRQRLKGEDAFGNIININARNNMDSFGEGVGSFTGPELEAVRLYLLKVRDLVVANPAPAFSFPNTFTSGSGSSSSIASTVAIQNWRGTSVSYSFSLVGANPGDYSITAGSSGSCAGTSSLAAPNNCNANVTVRFSPTAGGSRPATLRMTFTVPGADPIPFTRDFSLTGTGVVPAPIYQGSTSSLNFSARLGSSVNNSMTITNSAGASANLVLSAFNYSAPQYTRSVSSTCTIGISLAPGASCTLTTTFTPGAAGAQNGSLSIVHNAAGSPDAVTLTGTGTQSLISPTSSSLAFGNVQ